MWYSKISLTNYFFLLCFPAFSVVLKNYSLNDDELQNALGSDSSSEMEVESDDEVDLIVVSIPAIIFLSTILPCIYVFILR